MDPDRSPRLSDQEARAARVRLLKERVEANAYRVPAQLVAEAILAFHLGPGALNGSRPEPPSQSTT